MNGYYREYCLTTPIKQDKCENTPQKNVQIIFKWFLFTIEN